MSSSTRFAGPAVLVARKILGLAEAFETSTDDEIERRSLRAQIQDTSDELLRSVLTPSEYAVLVAEAFHESSALNLVNAAKVTDILGDNQLSATELAETAGVNPHHLGTALTCLVSKGIFVEPNGFGTKIFKNNEYSRVLSSSHPSAVDSAVGFICDEGFKAAARLVDAASPQNTTGLPAGSLAFNAPIPLFKWIASTPENAWRGERQLQTYNQLHHIANHGLEEDFNWAALKCPIVDIGCGTAVTEQSLLSLSATAHLTFTLFDLPPVIAKTQKIWANANLLDKATFVSGDFLKTPTEIPANAPTYVLRHIFLEWQDEQSLVFLKNIHDAMPKDGVLLVIEVLLHEDSDRLIRTSSMHMLSLNNAVTRTVPETIVLLEKAGFKLKKINRLPGADSVTEFIKS